MFECERRLNLPKVRECVPYFAPTISPPPHIRNNRLTRERLSSRREWQVDMLRRMLMQKQRINFNLPGDVDSRVPRNRQLEVLHDAVMSVAVGEIQQTCREMLTLQGLVAECQLSSSRISPCKFVPQISYPISSRISQLRVWRIYYN